MTLQEVIYLILAALVIACSFWIWANHRFHQSSGSTGLTIKLAKSPNQMTSWDIAYLATLVFLKHLPSFTGYTAPLRTDNVISKPQFILPQIRIHGPLEITHRDIHVFETAVPSPDPVPSANPLNPLFLVALTSPLVIRLLAQRSCPIRPLGAVNTRNAITIHDPSLCRDPSTLTTYAQTSRLTCTATFGGPANPGRRTSRGVEFRIHISILLDSQHSILSQELWYLQTLNRSHALKPVSVTTKPPVSLHFPVHTTISTLSLTRATPHLWAASCRDYNPIHTSPVGARLFGFPATIAHGNHILALLLQQVPQNPPLAASDARRVFQEAYWLEERGKELVIEVRFRRPVVLPARGLQVQWFKQGVEVRFEVLKDRRVCVEGSVGAAKG